MVGIAGGMFFFCHMATSVYDMIHVYVCVAPGMVKYLNVYWMDGLCLTWDGFGWVCWAGVQDLAQLQKI